MDVVGLNTGDPGTGQLEHDSIEPDGRHRLVDLAPGRVVGVDQFRGFQQNDAGAGVEAGPGVVGEADIVGEPLLLADFPQHVHPVFVHCFPDDPDLPFQGKVRHVVGDFDPAVSRPLACRKVEVRLPVDPGVLEILAAGKSLDPVSPVGVDLLDQDFVREHPRQPDGNLGKVDVRRRRGREIALPAGTQTPVDNHGETRRPGFPAAGSAVQAGKNVSFVHLGSAREPAGLNR